MKISLNILPEEYKKSLRQQKIVKHLFLLIFQMGVLSFVFCCMLIGILWGMHYYERTSALYADNFDEENLRELQKYEEQSVEENEKMGILQKVFETQYSYTNIFLLFDEIFPEKMYIEKIEFTLKKGIIYGIAEERDSIIFLQKRMEEHECFSEVNIPIGELVTKEDVVFTLSFVLENEERCLQRKL